MILFLYGADSWSGQQKLQQIVTRARTQGVDATNTVDLDAGEVEAAAIREAATAAPFLAKQRLLIIRNVLTLSPTASEAGVAALADGSSDTIIVAVETGEPDKRRTAYKALLKAAEKSWHFPALDEPTARTWLTREAAGRSFKLTPEIVSELVQQVGTDLWALSTELDKLALLDGPITSEKIAELIPPVVHANIFDLVDAMGRRQPEQALQELHRLLEVGEPPLRILAMMIRQFRQVQMTKSLKEQRASDAETAKRLGVPPFAVRKLQAQSDAFSDTELRQLYSELQVIDEHIKTGRRDPAVALELFIAETGTTPTSHHSPTT